MPKFHPTAIIQDCWSSIGNITFYHRGGQCYYKRKPYTQYRGTAAQLDGAQVHHRAILAWQQLQHSVQLEWRELAKSVPSHRPPFDGRHHISGYNLFVSSYHGFAQLGREHVPLPQPYQQFPISSMQLQSVESGPAAGTLSIRCRLSLQNTTVPGRWHPSANILLTPPGVGCNPGLMRTYLGSWDTDSEVVFVVPDPSIPQYTVHLRYRLIDSVTGYRNNWLKPPKTVQTEPPASTP